MPVQNSDGRKAPFQLNPRQILAVLITVVERLIIFPAHLCKLFQLRRALLYGVDVIIRDIFLRAKVLLMTHSLSAGTVSPISK